MKWNKNHKWKKECKDKVIIENWENYAFHPLHVLLEISKAVSQRYCLMSSHQRGGSWVVSIDSINIPLSICQILPF